MADLFVGEIHEVRKGLWVFFSWLSFSDADWLVRQTLGNLKLISPLIGPSAASRARAVRSLPEYPSV